MKTVHRPNSPRDCAKTAQALNKKPAPTKGAANNRLLRREAVRLNLRQINLVVPARDYERIWTELGPSRTNIRAAILAERAVREAQAKSKEQRVVREDRQEIQADLPLFEGAA
jgi:hypothetical protein